MLVYLPTLVATQPFKTVHSISNLICSFLPANDLDRDWGVGYYSQCYIDNNSGNQWRFVVNAIFGGLTYGKDMLFQVSENNMISTAFYYATSPQKNLVAVQFYNYEGGWYSVLDSFYIQSYNYLSFAQITHLTTTVNDYDLLTVTYTPKGNVSAGTSSG
jgi:hypothetical protein